MDETVDDPFLWPAVAAQRVFYAGRVRESASESVYATARRLRLAARIVSPGGDETDCLTPVCPDIMPFFHASVPIVRGHFSN